MDENTFQLTFISLKVEFKIFLIESWPLVSNTPHWFHNLYHIYMYMELNKGNKTLNSANATYVAFWPANLLFSMTDTQHCLHACVMQCLFQLALWKTIFFGLGIVVKNGLKCCLLIGLKSNNVCHNSVFKICIELIRPRLMGPQHFDHWNDAYRCQKEFRSC